MNERGLMLITCILGSSPSIVSYTTLEKLTHVLSSSKKMIQTNQFPGMKREWSLDGLWPSGQDLLQQAQIEIALFHFSRLMGCDGRSNINVYIYS